MQVRSVEDLASHDDPELCVGGVRPRRSVDRGTRGRSIEPRKVGEREAGGAAPIEHNHVERERGEGGEPAEQPHGEERPDLGRDLDFVAISSIRAPITREPTTLTVSVPQGNSEPSRRNSSLPTKCRPTAPSAPPSAMARTIFMSWLTSSAAPAPGPCTRGARPSKPTPARAAPPGRRGPGRVPRRHTRSGAPRHRPGLPE